MFYSTVSKKLTIKVTIAESIHAIYQETDFDSKLTEIGE